MSLTPTKHSHCLIDKEAVESTHERVTPTLREQTPERCDLCSRGGWVGSKCIESGTEENSEKQ